MSRLAKSSSSLLKWSVFFFFFSGATGLIYQVLWTRRLTLVFGHTVLAVSTVLTAFMAGLALGSLAAGHWTDSRKQDGSTARFLADYGYLEGFVGAWALLALPLLDQVERFYVWAAATGLSGTALHLSCFAAAALVLVPPTTAMGATVPILSRLLVQQSGDVGGILSRLYGLNTMGALFGAFLGGFVLLPTLGLRVSTVLAALVNFAIAFGAVRKAAEFKIEPAKKPAKRANVALDRSGPQESRGSWLVPVSFALAGTASMGYQVAWNRTLCLAIGSSIYAFSTILVMFLAGLGLGSLLYPRLMKSRSPGVFDLALLYLAIGIGGAFTVMVLPSLPKAFFYLFPLAGGQFLGVLLIDFLLVGVLLLPPTLAMGLGFPMATAIYSQSLARLGRSVGTVYGANTLGCIVGAFLTGFVCVPRIGAQWTLQLATLLYLLNALGLCLTIRSRVAGRALGGGCLLAALFTLMLPRWEKAVLASGTAIYSGNRSLSTQFSTPAVYLDGLSSAVSFHLDGENWEIPNMRVNGKVDASRAKGDRLTQYLLGYLPTLLHAAPKHVAIIGLGGGFTVEAVACCPGVGSIDVAELEPAVVAMGEYWKPFNGRVLEDPRVRVDINDGRTFVLAAQEPFDVIISEPSNPWIAGIGNLFTRDFYCVARERLRPDGIMCQWFNLYAVSETDMKMVIRGFYDVFPCGHLWQSSGGDLVLVGSKQPVKIDLNRIHKAWQDSPGIQRHFFEGGLYHPDSVAGHYLMTREEALEMAGPGLFNSDDRPLLEFSAPFSLYRPEVRVNQLARLRADSLEVAPGVTVDGRWALFGVLNRENYQQLHTALAGYQANRSEDFVLAAALEMSGQELDAFEKARAIWAACLERFPGQSSLAALQWADQEYQRQGFARAAELYQVALANPTAGSAGYLTRMLGQSYFNLGDNARAISPLLQSAQITTTESTALALAGAALVNVENYVKAEEVLQLALKRNPNDPVALKFMANAKFHKGDSRAAEDCLLRYLTLCPNYPLIWVRLAYCRRSLGDERGVAEAVAQALRLAPGDPGIADLISKMPPTKAP